MKKLIINALGIGSVFTLIAMVVMTVCWKDEDNNRIGNVSGNRHASMRNRIDRLSDNINPQQVVGRSDNTYSSSSNLRYVYESSNSGSSEFYDPTDYSSGDSFDLRNAGNRIQSDNEIKAADIIE